LASSIYIHLPFCKTKCPYCDFASFADQDKQKQMLYFQALKNEIKARLPVATKKANLKTIFFGGGTPSIHEANEIEEVLNLLKEYFNFDDDIEITLEANPGTVEEKKLLEFKKIGINRLSLGVQTFDEELISYLARGHSVEEAKAIIELVKSIGFKSWSLDLIYGLPHQNLEQWINSIEIALSYDPPHISSYALSIEENTPFGKIYENSKHKDLPTENSVVDMYYKLDELLEKHNLERYEISNWAQVGHQAQHNLCYWRAQEYYAFGLSAHGYINKKRYANTKIFQQYLENFKSLQENISEDFVLDDDEVIEYVTYEKSIEEQILLQLRLAEGLKLSPENLVFIDQGKLDKYLDMAYLKQEDNRLFLTKKALMISNNIIFELIK
jgi:oxygen-independent coproporphyrinogen-3 oxidase